MINKPKLKPILRKRRPRKQPRMKRDQKLEDQTQDQLKLRRPEPLSPVTQKRSDKHLKFAGPIKIIVVEPKSEYCKSVWCAIGIGLTAVAIVAVNMSALHYSLKTGDVHVVLCCLAYHFFSAEAILALHYANGWSAPMRLRHRKFALLCGIACAIAGTVVVSISKGISVQPHGLTGILTFALVIASALIGPFAFFKKKAWLLILHMTFAIPAFIMSSICVCLGVVLQPFQDWAGHTVIYILIALVSIYTLFIATSSFMKCMSRI